MKNVFFMYDSALVARRNGRNLPACKELRKGWIAAQRQEGTPCDRGRPLKKHFFDKLKAPAKAGAFYIIFLDPEKHKP